MAADASQYEKPKLYRDPPPKPPEHVYGRVPRILHANACGAPETADTVGFPAVTSQLRSEAALRVTVVRYKAGHTFKSSEVMSSDMRISC